MAHYVEREDLPEGLTVVVEYDPEPGSPRAWDNLARVTLVDRCRYSFGDDTASAEELRRMLADSDLVAMPIFIYDHSGITINTTGFSCPWDSGMVGVVSIEKARARAELGVKRLNLDRVRQLLRAEIETLDQYITGMVYGYRVQDSEGEELASCWGFYGDSADCLAEGLSEARAIAAAMDRAAVPA
jgi:hypothetical protein